MEHFNKIDIETLETKPVQLISKVWMLVSAGRENNFNSMTASWGGLGFLWNRPVAFVFVRPQRYTLEFIEKEPVLTLSFFDKRYRKALNLMGTKSGRDIDKPKEAGLNPLPVPSGSVAFSEAHYILECRKLYADNLKPENFIDKKIPPSIYPAKDFHKLFIVEIIQAWQNKEIYDKGLM